MDIGPQELIIVLIIVLVLFGGSKLPKLAKNLGQAQSEFKKGLAEGRAESESERAQTEATPVEPTSP